MTEIKNILCAVDFSEISPRVAGYAQTLAEKLKAKVHVLYVAPSIDQYAYLRIPPTDFQDHVNAVIIDAEKTMENFIRENFTMANVSGRVLSGYVAEIILDFARIENIDLIVMGTHGRQGVDRILFGSVAEKVIKSSKIPVLSVRPG
jgi:nucleotide-binding universal stress UspA family protein